MVSKRQEQAAPSEAALFENRSTVRQSIDAVLVPLVFGAITGATLHVPVAYWILSAVAALAGFAAGREHRQWRPAAVRGLVAGVMFGIGVIVVYYSMRDGVDIRVTPSPSAGTPVVTGLIGAALTAVGVRALGRRAAH